MPCNAKNSWDIPFEWCRDEKKYPVVYKDGDKHYCIFHAPKDKKFKSIGSDETLSLEEFNKLVYEEIDRAKKEKRPCDLCSAIFPGVISFEKYNKDNPLPAIRFFEAEFEGAVFFCGTEFSDGALFNFAKFGDDAYFSMAQFGGDARFFIANFGGDADFRGAKFGDDADFHGVRFGGLVRFSEAQFVGKANFAHLTIEERVLFENLPLPQPSFLGTNLRECDFIAVEWKEDGGRFVLYDEALLRREIWRKLSKSEYNLLRPLKWLALRVREFFSPSNEMKIRAVEHLYREMKLKAGEMNDHYSYSHWHQSEKEMQYLRASIKHPFHFAAIKLYSLLSGFGENPARAFFVLIVLILLSAVWFGLVGLKPSKGRGDTVRIEEATDLFVPKTAAALPLTTLQYAIFEKDPTYQPANTLGQYLKVLVKILIPIQAALFAFALRNRFRR